MAAQSDGNVDELNRAAQSESNVGNGVFNRNQESLEVSAPWSLYIINIIIDSLYGGSLRAMVKAKFCCFQWTIQGFI